MGSNEQALLDRIAKHEKLTAKDELTPGYRGELRRIMLAFVDSELAGASGFVDIIKRAPGMRDRSTASRIVSEKFEHAQKVLTLLEEFGVNIDLYVQSHAWDARLSRTIDLGNRRIAGDKRLNVFHYPIDGWMDAVVVNFLMGAASSIQLDELTTCSYAPLAAEMGEISAREAEHAELGLQGLKKLAEDPVNAIAIQASVSYWYPRIAATFGGADSQRFEKDKAYGLRKTPNTELLAKWETRIADPLERLGVTTPAK